MTELLLGAPGVYNWKGTTILYKDTYYKEPEASRIVFKKRQAEDILEFGYLNIAGAHKTLETYAFSYTGYSVTSGYFFSKDELLYVTSGPREHYFGQVNL